MVDLNLPINFFYVEMIIARNSIINNLQTTSVFWIKTPLGFKVHLFGTLRLMRSLLIKKTLTSTVFLTQSVNCDNACTKKKIHVYFCLDEAQTQFIKKNHTLP